MTYLRHYFKLQFKFCMNYSVHHASFVQTISVQFYMTELYDLPQPNAIYTPLLIQWNT